ncbi:MAG: type VI secretion system baseplate subunit TssF [Deltaproteobacteria bacterium]|nr:type VI secretion system baseplate subunit TssF [Deltaproteobacteria bacterium]
MFSKYYQSELTYLRELGRAFALANPAIAGLLAERGGDPDVERLLEGFAFLTARVRERIDDSVPEIVQSLAQLILPQYLRTLPAAAIVELSPIMNALRGRQRVPRGTELAAVPMEGTSCRFRTTADIDLVPLAIQDVVLDPSAAGLPVVRVQLQTTEPGRALVLHQDGVRFFVQGELSVASTLLLWFLKHCRKVTIKGASGRGRSVELPGSVVSAPAFDPANAMLPWPDFAPAGYRLVQEYLTFPQKFLFFDVKGLDAALADVLDDRIELAFQFDRPPDLPARIGKDILRLHCAPVINLFRGSSDPIRRDPLQAEYLLRAADVDPYHMEIYAVDAVVGLQAGRAERKTYHPFFAFTHALQGGSDQAYYRIRRTPSPVDDGIDTYLALVTPRDARPEAVEETLSLDIVCTNRSLPSKLRPGDISVPTQSSPTTAKFKNITPVTKPIRPPLGSELHWRLLSHLAIGHRSLADAAVLRAVLDVYNFHALAEHQVGRTNRLRIEAIQNVTSRPITRLLGNTPVRGVQTTVEIEESNFAGRGDAFVFGSVIEELFAAHVTMNSFNELLVRLQPSQSEYRWPARNGRVALL